MDEARIRALVERQANDEGCWFVAQTCAEAYLQRQLRALHAAIEGTDVECDACGGNGEVFSRMSHAVNSATIDPPFEIMEPCSKCNGAGRIAVEERPC